MDKGSHDNGHTVAAFSEELKQLSATVLRMGGLAESQLASAIEALVKRDAELAERVIASDRQVDRLDGEIATFTTRLFALRQPMAIDLRAILSAIRLAGDIERVGDLAKNTAKRVIVLHQGPLVDAVFGIARLGEMAQRMVKDALDAYAERDVERAIEVWNRDDDLDRLYNSLFRELLTYMMEDPRTITACTHLLFVAKNLERVGDHATNMAETVYFLIEGRRLQEESRPKANDPEAMAGPPAAEPTGPPAAKS